MTVTAFLPCRAGSERVPNKNTRAFAGEPDGLLGIKLDQLLATRGIDRILLSSNDPQVIAIGEKRGAGRPGSRLDIDLRPDILCSSSTSTDAVIAHVPTVIPAGDVLWTHVTSPFFTACDYDAAISSYRSAKDEGFDSLMGVSRLSTFLWNGEGPVNYDREQVKWPRTQTLAPLWEVNSTIFLAPIDVYRQFGDRIGKRPKLYEVEHKSAVDVDWPEDFDLAERLWAAAHTAS